MNEEVSAFLTKMGLYATIFPFALIAINGILQIATRAIAKQYWACKREATEPKKGSKNG